MHEPAQNCKTVQFFGEKYALKLFVTLKMGTFLFHLILQKSYKTLTTVENLRMWIT